MHLDHLQGFPFFAPAYQPSTQLHIFGPQALETELEASLAHTMAPPYFPISINELRAAKSMHGLQEDQVVLLENPGQPPRVLPAKACLPAALWQRSQEDGRPDVAIHVLRSNAHPGSVLVYRIDWRGRSVVYATDTESNPGASDSLVEFARGADLLIHDAQYTAAHYQGQAAGFPATGGWGHSTAEMACDVARAAGVNRLVLFHHEPCYDDATVAGIELAARARFSRSGAAYEGLEIHLPLTRRVCARLGQEETVAAQSMRLPGVSPPG
jgi:ribonuclease BN (tRNA processing enzyme)